MSADVGTYAFETYPDCTVCGRPLNPDNVAEHTQWHAAQLQRATDPTKET